MLDNLPICIRYTPIALALQRGSYGAYGSTDKLNVMVFIFAQVQLCLCKHLSRERGENAMCITFIHSSCYGLYEQLLVGFGLYLTFWSWFFFFFFFEDFKTSLPIYIACLLNVVR